MINAQVNYLACLLLVNGCSTAAAPRAPIATPDAQVVVDIETVPTARAPVRSPAETATTPQTAALPAGEPPHPCELMRRDTEVDGDVDAGAVSHLGDPLLEQSVRRYYEREVLGTGLDQRRLAQHPVVFQRGVQAPAAAAAACVEFWRAEDPAGVVPGTPHFVTDHEYVEVAFEFNDAADGENAYTVFVDASNHSVVAGFFYNNFQP
jgi:hypothetical protein